MATLRDLMTEEIGRLKAQEESLVARLKLLAKDRDRTLSLEKGTGVDLYRVQCKLTDLEAALQSLNEKEKDNERSV